MKKTLLMVSWVMTPCSDVTGYQRSERLCCLHLQSTDGGSMALRKDDILPHHYTLPNVITDGTKDISTENQCTLL